MSRRLRRRPKRLTPLELDVMTALWSVGAGTVRTVRDRLSGRPQLAYNTVQTVLGILHKKGHVRRKLAGRSFVYAPVATRQGTARNVVREVIVKLFGGSGTELVMSVIDEEKLSRGDLRRIRLMIRKHEHERD